MAEEGSQKIVVGLPEGVIGDVAIEVGPIIVMDVVAEDPVQTPVSIRGDIVWDVPAFIWCHSACLDCSGPALLLQGFLLLQRFPFLLSVFLPFVGERGGVGLIVPSICSSLTLTLFLILFLLFILPATIAVGLSGHQGRESTVVIILIVPRRPPLPRHLGLQSNVPPSPQRRLGVGVGSSVNSEG